MFVQLLVFVMTWTLFFQIAMLLILVGVIIDQWITSWRKR